MNHKRNAFTLIELLVVIAIIAILAAILFPVFAQAKVAAKKAATLSQVKQILTASVIYQGDYDDTFAPKLRIGFGPANGGNDPTNAMSFEKILYPYTKNWGIFMFPLDGRTRFQTPQGLFRRSFGVASNVFRGIQARSGALSGITAGKDSINESRIQDTGATVAIAEKRQKTDPRLPNAWTLDEWFYGIEVNNTRRDDLPVSDASARYGEISYINETTYFGFVDSHVKSYKMGSRRASDGAVVGVMLPGYAEKAAWWVGTPDPFWDRGLSCFDSDWSATGGDCPLPGERLP